MWKRGFDIIVSLIALFVLLPLFLVIALAIRLQDGGPVFYRQQRVGLHGRLFCIFKFRSMVPNADRIGGHATADGDQRITRVGRFIRRTSMDELPQLLNVIAGDMSVVGPRPDVPAQRDLYSATEFERRHSVRPGITGLAQALLRSDATAEQRKALDLDYVGVSGLWQDLKIVALTVRQVVTKGGN